MNIIGTNILRIEEFNEDLTALTTHFPFFFKKHSYSFVIIKSDK